MTHWVNIPLQKPFGGWNSDKDKEPKRKHHLFPPMAFANPFDLSVSLAIHLGETNKNTTLSESF